MIIHKRKEGVKLMEPYEAIAVQSVFWACQKRDDIKRNLDHIASVLPGYINLASTEGPVKLVALPELALTGATDEHLDWDYRVVLKDLCIDIPGEETNFLGDLCKKFGIYLIAQCKARDLELWPDGDRLFNFAFIIDPNGKVIHKHRKTAVWRYEHSISTCPHDIWDRYVEKFGTDPKKLLEAIFPVARTEIGNIGTLICYEGSFPEAARALAMNGAEIIYRPTYVEPWVGPPRSAWEIQNRSHAIFNTCYVIAPNVGGYYKTPWLIKDWKNAVLSNNSAGHTMMIDYKGSVIHECDYAGCEGFSAGTIDIERLREYRVGAKHLQTFLKDLKVEQYKLIYEAAEAMGGIFPKNDWMKEAPRSLAETDKIVAKNIRKLIDSGIWTAPESMKKQRT
jgi:predicted amidohydrolase